MELEQRNLYINLFDIYKELLTEKQISYFSDYYLYDLSFSEIAENYSVSRNAVFDQIKKVIAILENYENKLCILKNKNLIIEELNKESISKENILKIIEE